ncbi:MAG: oligosaccharide flippase family protein [Parcubacteria group bacterium]
MNSKIIKNAVWLFSGQVVGRALRAILIVVAARLMGTSDWGVFSYAISLAAAFTVFSDVGINALLVREGSKDSGLTRKYLSTGLAIKLILLTVLSLAAVFLKGVIIRIPEAESLIHLIIIIFVFDSLRDYVSALARSFERMDIEAEGQIITNIGIVVFGLLFLFINPTADYLAFGYVLGTLIGLIAVFIPLRHYFKGLVKEFSRKLIREILVSAWPFGLVSLMGVITINTDTIVLGSVGSASDVGLFAAAQKPVQLLYLIPSLLVAAFLPTLSREASETSEFRETLEKGLKAVYLFAIPLALGGILASKSVVHLLYGPEFQSSWASFALLSATFFFVFPSIFFTNALFARGSQKSFYGYLAIGVVANVILDLALIPVLGIAGCALATLVVQIALFIYGVIRLKKSLSFRVFPDIKRIVISALVMAAAVVGLLLLNAHSAIIVVSGFAVYFLMLMALREPTLKEVVDALRKKPGITSSVEV